LLVRLFSNKSLFLALVLSFTNPGEGDDTLSNRHIDGTSCELRLARVPMFIGESASDLR